MRPVTCPLWVHGPQLRVALCHGFQTPQLVVDTFTLLGQDVNVSDYRAANRTRAAVSSEEEPRQGGILAHVLFSNAAGFQTQKNSYREKARSGD